MSTKETSKYYKFLEEHSKVQSCMYLATKALTEEFEELSQVKANDILLEWIVETEYFDKYMNRE